MTREFSAETRARMSAAQRKRYEKCRPVDPVPEPKHGVVFIYALLDPDRRIRYVGKSPDVLKRVKLHWSAKNSAQRWKRNPGLQGWLCSLDRCPEVDVLEEIESSRGFAAETYWIRLLKQVPSVNLFNVFETPAGNEVRSRELSEETRKKLSNAAKRRWMTPGQLAEEKNNG